MQFEIFAGSLATVILPNGPNVLELLTATQNMKSPVALMLAVTKLAGR